MRVVLDTNVVVSAAFFGGPPRTVLDAWADGRLHVIITPSIFDEYLRVCDRLRASYPKADYQAVLTELLAHGALVPDSEEDEDITADPDDDKFMRCASGAGAVVVSRGQAPTGRRRLERRSGPDSQRALGQPPRLR